MCSSTKSRRNSDMAFDQLELFRARVIASKQELDNVHSMRKLFSQLPDELEEILNEERICSLSKIKCNDEPLFNGDSFSEIKQWFTKKISESQETHVPVSEASKYIKIWRLVNVCS